MATSNSTPPLRACSRDNVKALGELAILYEEFNDATIPPLALEFLTFLEKCHDQNTGWVSGAKTYEWFTNPLHIASRAFPQWEERFLTLLREWERFAGNRVSIGSTGRLEGPFSLRGLQLVAENENNSELSKLAYRMAKTQSMLIYDNYSTSVGNKDWIGSGILLSEIFVAGNIRDYLSVLQWRRNNSELDLPPADGGYFQSRLPTKNVGANSSANVARSVFFVEKNLEENIDVHIDVHRHNMPDGRIWTRVYSPSDSSLANPIIDEQTIFTPAQQEDRLSTSMISDDSSSWTITIPSANIAGAYAVEVISYNMSVYLPISVMTTSGKVVYYNPEFQERLEHFQRNNTTLCNQGCNSTLNALNASWGAVQHPVPWSGTAWFRPKESFVDANVEFLARQGSSSDQFPTRIRVFNGDNELCTTRVVGKTLLRNAEEDKCKFDTGISPELHHVMLQQNGPLGLKTEGIGSFMSASESEWFEVDRQNTQIDPRSFISTLECGEVNGLLTCTRN